MVSAHLNHVMNRHVSILAMAIVVVPVVANARPERNAYLNKGVTSVQGLMKEVKSDPEVADRYMRHYGMSKQWVLMKFSKLHVEKLSKPYPIEMYSVPAGGAIKSHHCILKKGEAVFADNSGTPVLRYICGNPLEGGSTVAFALPKDVPMEGKLSSGAAMGSPSTDLQGVSSPVDAEASIPSESQLAEETTTPEVVSTPVTSRPDGFSVSPIGGGSSGIGALAFLPLAGAAAFIGTNGHGHGQVVPAPEPFTMVLVTGALIGAAAKRKKRQS